MSPLELITRQLGHKDVAMVAKVYGRFQTRHRGARSLGKDRRGSRCGEMAVEGAKGPPIETARLRNCMKKAPQLNGSARLQKVAGAGLEPATPALEERCATLPRAKRLSHITRYTVQHVVRRDD
jgi:hypothetical protein